MKINDLFDEEPVPFKIAASRIIRPIEKDMKCVDSCPVCGFKVFEHNDSHDICPVCKWEDDGVYDTEESENYILQNESELVYLMFKNRNKDVIRGKT